VGIEEIRIPDLGDAEDVEVIELCVEPGAHVEENDSLVVLESDKASMEVPAPHSGTVKEVKVAVGDKVAESQVIAVMEFPDESSTTPPESLEPVATTQARPESEAQLRASFEEPGTDKALRNTPSEETVQLPDVGDAQEINVIEVAVKPGDEVQPGDLLLVVESDKASMEIPATHAGTITEVLVNEGDEVVEGAPLIKLLVNGEQLAGGAEENSTAEAQEVSTEEPPPDLLPNRELFNQQSQLSEQDKLQPVTSRTYAGPAVRRMARELGVVLSEVKGSGNHGRITKEDVQAFVKSALAKPRNEVSTSGIPRVPEIDFSRFGSVEIVKLSRIRQRGAANLHRSWLNVPHVTQHDDVDVTELETFRKAMKPEAEHRGLKLTPLAFIIKACAFTLQQFPQVNASLDPDVQHFILKRYYHIGFAVDAPDGLLVPVIRDVNSKGIWQITQEITDLSEKARSGKLKPDDMQGGTFSVSSLGAIGGTGFTPIVNTPEVAILGVSRLDTRPVWNGTSFEPRQILPITLSYDHRAINGAEAGRFVTHLSKVLKDFRQGIM